MGYDFLGTFGQDQWSLLKSFTQAHASEMGIDGLHTKHIAAELKKIQRTQADLKRASANFNNFVGDVPYNPDLVIKDKNNPRYNLADGDTAYLVGILKNNMKPMLKRKKDNLEYRYKKFLDLEDQYGLKLDNLTTTNTDGAVFQIALENTISQVETHFVDGVHKHNTPRDGSPNDERNNITHTPDNIRVDREATVMDDLDVKKITRLRDVTAKLAITSSVDGGLRNISGESSIR